ncbi:sirohydrochlorin chelatase [Peterkaempfera griseoplana]|uniref:sirohydrochlorin chelatase n=1 Tax=Peterkaempfera griseoplana TaxID=66896 RepID=UPI0006E28214|nr:sirohydrochlorin chelatase [Peterkaempfera griseoplana]
MTQPLWNSSASELLSEIATRFSTGLSARHTCPAEGARPPALVAVAHGSRDPAARTEIQRLLDQVRALRPGLPVHLAHLGLNDPLLPDVLDRLTGRAVLVPLLLGRGYHVRVDIPRALAAAPHLDAAVAAPLGPHPLLTQVLHTRLAEAGWDARGGDAVVLAAAGSRDPAAAADTEAQARLLSARLGVPVLPGYVAAAAPTVAEAVAALTARGHRRVAVSGYFTAPGDFARLAAAAGRWLTAAPLGPHPALARLVLARYDDAAGLTRATDAEPRALAS